MLLSWVFDKQATTVTQHLKDVVGRVDTAIGQQNVTFAISQTVLRIIE